MDIELSGFNRIVDGNCEIERKITMARLKFKLWKDDWCKKERGLMATFTDGRGQSTTHWFSSPSTSINHACTMYLKSKFGNVRTERQANFIREQYAEQITSFPEFL